ncbi:response regulator transcription factor [Myxococcus sp. K15C18031901]|uniref:exopolysaccharide biosynthesis response regulator EpsW n=1 Tax=Myxococcus dinghuensis TaxID=2906761 RepID=UPI0020A6DCC5|nr:exopolysaccharide biosynthesis response regulator EpsW [Myxococcus dinghuensis]MCP3103050.1 response regulator transcription factor [Myxococcus dinghuensis]
MEPQLHTVLLVEDAPFFRKMLGDYLRAMGFANVVELPNGQAALKHLATAARPDLVCLDLTLPDISGYDLCEHIRRTAGMADVPVLVVSARDLPEDKAHAEEAGANGYLGKPFTQDEFSRRVEQLLKNSAVRSRS